MKFKKYRLQKPNEDDISSTEMVINMLHDYVMVLYELFPVLLFVCFLFKSKHETGAAGTAFGPVKLNFIKTFHQNIYEVETILKLASITLIDL